jgi:hypothetical protein
MKGLREEGVERKRREWKGREKKRKNFLLFYFNLSILFIFYNICNILGKHCAITQIEQAHEIFIAECSSS